MKVKRAYKYRIRPNKTQSGSINRTFGCSRLIWNLFVESFNSFGKIEHRTSKQLKDSGEYPFLEEVSAAALQQKDRDIIEFKTQFFNKARKKKVCRPKFKKKNISRDSYRLPNQKFSLNQHEGWVRLEKIGKVKVVIDRLISEEAKFLSVTVSRDKVGDYFVSILVEEEVHTKQQTKRSVGIDLGFKDLLVTSDGLKIENPKLFRKTQTKIARLNKKLSKAQKGSKRREKAKMKLAKTHRKLTRIRNNIHHNISSWLVDNYDIIVLEDLNIAAMSKGWFGKSVGDASLSTLVSMIKYKATWYGKTFHQIDRFYPSSKTCNCCGHVLSKEQLTLDMREWTCQTCGATHDRDHNAAINILKQGLSDLYELPSDELAEVIGRGIGEVRRFRLAGIATSMIEIQSSDSFSGF